MRWCGGRPWRRHAVVVAALAVAVAGCSDGAPGGQAASSARPSGIPRADAAPAGAIGISPSGVTTRVDVPADSTEEEYFQACHAAKSWMQTESGKGGSVLEEYLAVIQSGPSGTPGTWNVRWSDLTPARQAAVIIAARAAANDECG